MAAGTQDRPWLPPRWFIRGAWYTHRALYRISGGRIGLWRPNENRYGTMRLTATGRRSGQQRSVILAYLEDGQDVVTMAMNGWADPEPAWWLNLQANPDAQIVLPDGPRTVRARAADPQERARLWALWCQADKKWDAYSQHRSTETAVVILEPRPQAGR